MWAFLLGGIGRWLIVGLAGILAVGGLYLKGRVDGTAACIGKQQAQMAKMETYVKQIRERIERNQPIGDDILRSDPFERPEN